jgi:mono/diheme cytochrome c family protein
VAVWYQFWTSTVDWPLNVGGRPWNSWPAYVPVIFEMMVLLGGFGVAFAFLLVSRLYPGKGAVLPYPGVTHDRFVLVVENAHAGDGTRMRALCASAHAVDVLEQEEGQPQSGPPRPIAWRRWNVALAVMLIVTVGLNWVLSHDPRQRGTEFLPNMVHSPAYDTFSRNPHLPEGVTLQSAVPGTIARGQKPLHYQATPADALRAGAHLVMPRQIAADPQLVPKGAKLFATHCQMCHGSSGLGDGPVARKGVPAVSLLTDKARGMKEGQVFHVLTLGQGNMAPLAVQLSEAERWQVIGYLHSLQKQGEKKAP